MFIYDYKVSKDFSQMRIFFFSPLNFTFFKGKVIKGMELTLAVIVN